MIDTRRSAAIIDGRARARKVLEDVKSQARKWKAKSGVVPGIAVVIVGDNPASAIYVASKEKTAKECGFHSRIETRPATASTSEILDLLGELNVAPDIHGILVQLPLPTHIDAGKVIQAISPGKDVDGFHFVNVGRLATGAVDGAIVPCTPAGAILLIGDILGPDLSGRRAVVLGRSNIVGKPMANLLLAANATVTVAHSRSHDLAALCREADILVAAVGRPELVRGHWIKPGAVVIDVGINRVQTGEGRRAGLVGDVAFEEAQSVAGAITPVPGGVGPMTIAMLMANTLNAAIRGGMG
ncbi:bifunctional 5,10-methylenetetrahydrofolate dehydrogenase/5,10-methenyltetrahydrofolate cyclohydrolase [Aminobacter ciceronei]|nr:bifunctional methylenetetrahydrofolate dehydrogenase/methenyltetrahydrofolate cyclohydrolase FolD [Aminobacter ciceronei]